MTSCCLLDFEQSVRDLNVSTLEVLDYFIMDYQVLDTQIHNIHTGCCTNDSRHVDGFCEHTFVS